MKLQPLHDKIDQVTGKYDEVSQLKEEVLCMKQENYNLRSKIENLERFRRNNIRLYNIKEQRNEDLDVMMVDLLNNYLAQQNYAFNENTFERIHRIGKPQSGKTCVVIVRFHNFKDKQRLLKMLLKQNEGIGVSENFTPEVEERRARLFPIMKAIQRKLSLEKESTKIYLKSDKIMFNGKQYGTENLDTLPAKYRPESLFTAEKDDITAFFSKNSPLSNHFPCNFKLEGEKFNCLEQYLMIQKALLFSDQDSVLKISSTDNPVQQKRLGKSAANFKEDVWRAEVSTILFKGLCAKFNENPHLGAFLLNTGDNEIVEANGHDAFLV